MTTAAVSMVKDECDVIAGTVLHMAAEVDFLVIADNASTDGTREILAELEDLLPLTVLDDPDPAYYQSEKVSSLASAAADQGADWIVPFDADELWVWRGDRIANELADCKANVVVAEVYDHRASAVDPPGDDPFRTIVYRTVEPIPMRKVAFKWSPGAVVHQGNHGVDLSERIFETGGLEVRHFPYRSAEQFVKKARNGAAAYAATDLPYQVGQHWRDYGALLERHGEEALHDVYRQYFWNLVPSLAEPRMVFDPAPYMRWQSQ